MAFPIKYDYAVYVYAFRKTRILLLFSPGCIPSNYDYDQKLIN